MRLSEADIKAMRGVDWSRLDPAALDGPSRQRLTAAVIGLPVAEDAPGPWVVTIGGWLPPTVNALMRGHWRGRARLKKSAVARVAQACFDAGIPLASGKRRVTIALAVPNRSHYPDPDNISKSLLDGLKRYGALIDDSADLCECLMPTVGKGPKCTVITIEDL